MADDIDPLHNNGNGKAIMEKIINWLFKGISVLLLALTCYLANDRLSSMDRHMETQGNDIQGIRLDMREQKTKIDILWQKARI